MVESRDSVENTLSKEIKNLNINSAAVSDGSEAPVEEYHSTEFWKKRTVGVVSPADAATVLAATKDLCRHFVSQEDPVLFMEKAAKLAAQFRRLDGGPLNRLLVDHAGLQQLFTLDPDVQLDIQASSWDSETSSTSSEESVGSCHSPQSSIDSESTNLQVEGSSSTCGGSFSLRSTEPLTMCSGDSPMCLSFSHKFLYKKKDQAWLEDFISSVDELTETQALIFGPAFATLFVVLRMTGYFIVSRDMSKLRAKLLEYAAPVPAVAQMVADLDVKMPPRDRLMKLLRVYAEVKLAPIYVNSVVGGLMYARIKQGWSKDDVNFSLLKLMNSMLPFYRLELVFVFLDLMQDATEEFGNPRIAHIYFGFLEQCFPESWRAISRLNDKYSYFYTQCLQEDQLWIYSGAFSDSVFDELSYCRNYEACNISAVVFDLLRHHSRCRNDRVKDWPKLGSTYRHLMRDKPSWMKISQRDAVLAENLYWVLLNEMGKPIPEERLITAADKDADSSADAEAKGGDRVSATASDLLAKPFVVVVKSRADVSTDEFLMAEEVRAFDGLRYLERVGRNGLKAEFDNVREAISFLLATANSPTLRSFIPTDQLFRHGIIRRVPLRISESDLLEELRKKSNVESVRRIRAAVDGQLSPLPLVELQFWGTELPPYVVYLKLRIPVESSAANSVYEHPNWDTSINLSAKPNNLFGHVEGEMRA